MDSVLIVLIFAVTLTGVKGWEAWLRHRYTLRELETRLALARLEREKLDILRQSLRQRPDA